MSSFKTQLYINGAYCDPVKGGTFTTFDPATNKPLAEVANATAEDIDIALKAATACLNSENWGYKSTGAQRAQILRRLGKLFEERKVFFAELDSLDQGKPYREADADLSDAISACEHFAMLAEQQDKNQGEVIDNGSAGDFVTTILYEPIGVIAAITPWNYPLLMGLWKVIPGIAAGCTMVLKPSELAPLSCLELGALCTEAGLPDGALNVCSGLGPDAGAPLATHELVDRVSFTGSVPTARKIMAGAALGPRGISLELGGKSPMIVFEDSDIPAAVDWIITGVLWGSGQVCSSTARVLVHSSIREPLMALLLEKIAGVSIGNSTDPKMRALNDEGKPVMGPVVSKGQCDKVWDFIDEAKAAGYTCVYGGERSMVAALGDGYFVPPTVFVDVPTESRIWKEEIFGPVLCVRSFETEAEAVAEANDSDYGLAAAVFSSDDTRVARVTKALRCGIVWTNNCQPAFIQAPWGGIKKSGFGRELGRWGIEEFSSVKAVHGCKMGFDWGLWK